MCITLERFKKFYNKTPDSGVMKNVLTICDDRIMISSVPSYDDELLNSAYANIGLIADKVWAFDQDDPFRKLNHTLWVQNCKLTAKYRENGNYQPRRVRDTIPGSWLAQYGNYEYDEERERMYKPGDNTPVVRPPDLYVGEVTEPWMLDEVEEHFARLSARTPLPLDDELFSQLQSSATEGLEPAGKLTDRGTGWILQSKWDDVLRKRYPTLESVLAGKPSKGKDTESCSLYTTNTKEPYDKNVDPEDYEIYPPPRYTVDNMAEMQLQIRVTSDVVRDLWNPPKPQQQHVQYGQRPQQHLHCSQQQQQHLQCVQQHQSPSMRPGRQSSCPESIGMMRRPPPPMLSAEVPEFFPKGPGLRSNGHQEQAMPLQFFPSSSERSYQDELFPYNRGHISNGGTVYQNTSMPVSPPPNTSSLIRSPQQWIQRTGPPMQVQVSVCASPQQPVCPSVQPVCPTVIQRPIQLHEKMAPNIATNQVTPAPIPVYQRPPELYTDPSQRRKTQGVDFNNLILLTKNAMKARRNQSKNPQQSSSFILESRQPNLKSETDVLQWLDKGYPKRAKEFVTVNTLVSEFQNFEGKCECAKPLTSKSDTEESSEDTKNAMGPTTTEDSSVKFSEGDTPTDAPTKRRLYRDVLTNSSSTGIILENVFDKRYDELERQAMEQYRTSEECLALRYQELERQAMEQYRNGDNGASSTSNSQGNSSAPVTPAKGKQRDESKSGTEDKECVGGHKCSGFGQCSPIRQSPSAGEKGTPLRQQITILRPESKPGSSATHRGANHKSARPAVVTKSLTTLNQKFSRDSKNTTKGASGDKIDKTVQASPKRRLILVSPLKRESGARLTKTSKLEETCTFQPINRHLTASYRKPEVMQTGGGDEKVTILRSPGAEGIRKQLFLANEELMDGSSESLGVRLLEPTQKDGPCVKLDLGPNTEEHTSVVSSEVSIFSIGYVEQGQEPGEKWRPSWIEQQKNNPKRATKNKRKQCIPHNIIAVKDHQTYYSDAVITSSAAFLYFSKKYGLGLFQYNSTPKIRIFDKSTFQLTSLNQFLNICAITPFILETFQDRVGLGDDEILPCPLSTLEIIPCCMPLYNVLKFDTPIAFIYDNLYLLANKSSSDNAHIYIGFGNKWFLTFRYYEVLPVTKYKIRLLSPLDVISVMYTSEKSNLFVGMFQHNLVPYTFPH